MCRVGLDPAVALSFGFVFQTHRDHLVVEYFQRQFSESSVRKRLRDSYFVYFIFVVMIDQKFLVKFGDAVIQGGLGKQKLSEPSR